ncbi:acyl-CoA dehydrogenase family protein [Actinoplanes sp. HUAS TT8]|uniref:acyl-CoA dehydrogenase family protein n=1 Tax=Actinoplanes sp. HUAS TT8 TaxID=3447453 RepID=UPI003F528094
MNLVPSPEQAQFAAVLHDLLSAAGVPAAADRWADGDHGPGLRLWEQLAEVGVTALDDPADLVIAAEELGHHAVPGPVAETIAAVPALSDRRGLGTLAAPPWLPYALDADVADVVLLADHGMVGPARAVVAHSSLDPTRRLFEVVPDGPARTCPDLGRALDLGALVCAAQLLGAGRALLEAAVDHARNRHQFGGPIGRFQAVRHRLADVAVGLEFARPLLHAAAVTGTARDISAAKVACSGAAGRAARTSLQVHGAIGYTRDHGLGRWLTKVKALSLAWGTPADHRARVMAELAKEDRCD